MATRRREQSRREEQATRYRNDVGEHLIPTIRVHAFFCDGHHIPQSRTIASLQSAATAFMKVGDMAHATESGLSSAQSLLRAIRDFPARPQQAPAPALRRSADDRL